MATSSIFANFDEYDDPLDNEIELDPKSFKKNPFYNIGMLI